MAIPAVPAIPCRGCGTALRAGGSATNEWFPFCSARCRDGDLGKWLEGAYAVPAEDADATEDAGIQVPDEPPA